MIDEKLLAILVCPVTKAPLVYDEKNQEFGLQSKRLGIPGTGWHSGDAGRGSPSADGGRKKPLRSGFLM